MANATSLHGVHVPLITPFTKDGRVADAALERLAHDVLDGGATGIVALGTTAETPTLGAEERLAVIEICARVCRERNATLIIGAGSNDTAATAAALGELTRWPQAAAVLVPVPYYTRPREAGVVAHFTQLAAGSPLPLIIYHVPYRTGQPLGPACLRALARLPQVVGIKYATGVIDQDTVDLLADLPPRFAVLAGDDVLLFPLLAMGAVGGILASAHLVTGRFAELVASCRRGDGLRARDLATGLAGLSAALFAEPNPTVIKAVLHAQGRIPTPDVRLPLLPAGPDSVEAVLKQLVDLGG
jgi:4-hydroxy-tetrahydrodipicolinate synthase